MTARRPRDPGPKPAEDPPTTPDAASAWRTFEARLAAVLETMEPATYLVLSIVRAAGREAGHFVQFAHGGAGGFRAEAASSHYLAPALALTPAQEDRLGAIGWQRPGAHPAARNFHREWPTPQPGVEIAAFAVRTLRDVYGVVSPDELRYRHGAFPTHLRPVEAPDLGILPDIPDVAEAPATAATGSAETGSAAAGSTAAPVTPAAPGGDGGPGEKPQVPDADVTLHLAAALVEFLGGAGLKPDVGGDIPIRVGSALMFVRPLAGRPPLVQLFSPLVRGVDLTPALLEALNDINRRILFGRAFWTDREVVVAMELTAIGISAEQIAFACVQLGNLADHLDDELRGRFGGSTVFEVHKALVN